MIIQVFRRPGTDTFRFQGDPRHVVALIQAPNGSEFSDLGFTPRTNPTPRRLLWIPGPRGFVKFFAEQAYIAATRGEHGLRMADTARKGRAG